LSGLGIFSNSEKNYKLQIIGNCKNNKSCDSTKKETKRENKQETDAGNGEKIKNEEDAAEKLTKSDIRCSIIISLVSVVIVIVGLVSFSLWRKYFCSIKEYDTENEESAETYDVLQPR
jgi:hypothetical protein